MFQIVSSVTNTGIDAASPVLLLLGCFLIGLFLLAINPALLIFTALLALGPALLASEKGRNPLNWWCYGFLLFIVAIIHAALTPAIPERATEEESARAFLGIGALASIVMSIVAWTQKL